MIVFTLIVCLTGGASRHDVQSLVLLRPLSFAFIAYALWIAEKEELRRLPVPFYLLLGLAVLAGLQLIPLPFSWWSQLPGREIFVDIAMAAGLEEQARPLTLTPARTWNTLFSLAVPIAAFLLFVIQDRRRRLDVLWLLIIAGAGSMFLGFLQTLGGQDSALYTYAIHNEGQAVGLFSNRNHQGAFLAVVGVLAALAIYRLRTDDTFALFKGLLLLSFLALSVPFILILGSRAGLILSLAGLLIAPWIIVGSPVVREFLQHRRKVWGRKFAFLTPATTLAGIYVAAAGLAAVAIANSRDEALSRLTETASDSRLDRGDVLPYLVRMVQDYLPFGSGFGSFDRVFYRYERTEHLSSVYLNQAHMDWLQVVIEGGIPAALLLAALIAWFFIKTGAAFGRRGIADKREIAGLAMTFVMIAIGSAVDYPLRVPIIMVAMTYIACLLSEGIAASTSPRRPRPVKRGLTMQST